MPQFGTIGDLAAGGRRFRKGVRFETGTIADLAAGRGFRKLDGDDGDEPDADRERLRELLANTVTAMQAAYNAAVDAQLKVLSALTPQARAVAEVAGDSAQAEYSRLLDSKFEIEKRLAVVDSQTSRVTIAKKVGEDERELATLRGHMAAVNDGQVRADEGLRRRLLAAISQTELRLAAAQ